MAWIQLRNHGGTGTIQIATGSATVERAIQDGIVDWPEDVPWPAGARVTAPLAEVRAQELARKRAEARALAESLGLRVVDDAGHAVPAPEADLLGQDGGGAMILGNPPPLTPPKKPAAKKKS
jgi:hypothetical protein